MPLVGGALRLGAVAFALGLSMAGPHAAPASADTPDGESPSASPGRAHQSAGDRRTTTKSQTKPPRHQPRTSVPQLAAAPAGPQIATAAGKFAASTANGPSRAPAEPISDLVQGGALLAHRTLARKTLAGAAGTDATVAEPTLTPPTITLHNNTGNTIWVYNLTNSGNYSIPADFPAVEVAAGQPTSVTLAPGTGPADAPKNRIYIVEGPAGFTLPVTSTSGVDAFNPTAPSAGNSFLNYSFVEYNLYSADGGSQYTIDTSYIDEWSLPIQMQFNLNGSAWTGAVDGKRYGFNDFDTVVGQLNAAGKAGTPYNNLVWSGSTPWGPQPPATVSRIIGPDKVWSQQSYEPASNVNMNQTGWVPTSYQNFVQYGSYTTRLRGRTVYPYAQDGKQYSANGNFNFWKDEVTAPASTPYPIALRTAAKLDGFPADPNGVYGFFTYPNDEAAGQFTNIPTAVSLDLHVFGSADGITASLIPGGQWIYSAPSGLVSRLGCDPFAGTSATDTFILNRFFKAKLWVPRMKAVAGQWDLVAIDKVSLRGATSNVIDVVDKARFWGRGDGASQFVYENSTGYLYYDRHPLLPGYTGVLVKLAPDQIDPERTVFVL